MMLMNFDKITPRISTAAFSRHILFCLSASGTCRILSRIRKFNVARASRFMKDWLQLNETGSVN